MGPTLRRRLAALAAAPLLLASLTASVPAASAETAATASRKDTYYSDATHTTRVGVGYGLCDGDYVMASGYQTSWFTTTWYAPCP